MAKKTSFALEYRKRLLAEQRRAREKKRSGRKLRARSNFSTRTGKETAKEADDTAANRARFLGAMLIAGLVLAVLNSEGLMHWSRGLSATAAGRQVFTLSMQWHEWMHTRSVDRLVVGIRDTVMAARHAAWTDLAQPFAAAVDPERVQNAASTREAGGRITGAIAVPPPEARHISRP